MCFIEPTQGKCKLCQNPVMWSSTIGSTKLMRITKQAPNWHLLHSLQASRTANLPSLISRLKVRSRSLPKTATIATLMCKFTCVIKFITLELNWNFCTSSLLSPSRIWTTMTKTHSPAVFTKKLWCSKKKQTELSKEKAKSHHKSQKKKRSVNWWGKKTIQSTNPSHSKFSPGLGT